MNIEKQRKILHDKLIKKVHSHWIRAWINRPFEEEEYTLEQYEKLCDLREQNEKFRENKKKPNKNYDLKVTDIVKFKWENKKGHKVELTGRLLKIEKRKKGCGSLIYLQPYYEILHCGEIFCDVEYCSRVRFKQSKGAYKHIKIPEIVKETSTEKLLGIYRSSQCYGYSYWDEDSMDVDDAGYIDGTEVPLESIKAELSLHRKHIKRKKEKHLKDKI